MYGNQVDRPSTFHRLASIVKNSISILYLHNIFGRQIIPYKFLFVSPEEFFTSRSLWCHLPGLFLTAILYNTRWQTLCVDKTVIINVTFVIRFTNTSALCILYSITVYKRTLICRNSIAYKRCLTNQPKVYETKEHIFSKRCSGGSGVTLERTWRPLPNVASLWLLAGWHLPYQLLQLPRTCDTLFLRDAHSPFLFLV